MRKTTWGELFIPINRTKLPKEVLEFLVKLDEDLKSETYEITDVWTPVGYHEPSCPRICEINELGKHRFVPNTNCKEKFGEH